MKCLDYWLNYIDYLIFLDVLLKFYHILTLTQNNDQATTTPINQLQSFGVSLNLCFHATSLECFCHFSDFNHLQKMNFLLASNNIGSCEGSCRKIKMAISERSSSSLPPVMGYWTSIHKGKTETTYFEFHQRADGDNGAPGFWESTMFNRSWKWGIKWYNGLSELWTAFGIMNSNRNYNFLIFRNWRGYTNKTSHAKLSFQIHIKVWIN